MSLDDILENCCAPFLMGLRPACMFVAPWDCKGEIRETFYDTNVQIMPMGQIGAGKELFFLYREEALEQEVNKTLQKEFLLQQGYLDFRVEELIYRLSVRYQAYAKGRSTFPHEFGIFLGYSYEDVVGFIEHEGEDFLYADYWKVYGNLEYKMDLFDRFHRAEKLFATMLHSGMDINSIIMQKG